MKYASTTHNLVPFALCLALSLFTSCSDEEDAVPMQSVPVPPLVPAPASVEAVDLGLPSGTKWASMNVGAEKPEDYGLYFAWAETAGYPTDTERKFDMASYKWFDSKTNSFTKYCTDVSFGPIDNIISLELADDAANANWGAPWEIPTFAEIQELCNNTINEWTSVNGINGYKFTSQKNGNSIFVPATGCLGLKGIGSQGDYGYYWSVSLYPSDSGCARGFFFDETSARTSGSSRFTGHTVRAVCRK